MHTASSVITAARHAFPDLSEAIALDLLNIVHNDLLARYHLRDDSITISVTAGIAEYALEETALRVEAAYYLRGPELTWALFPVNLQELDRMSPGWRERAAGGPNHYYLSANLTGTTVGLYPTPNQTTSGGYPAVKLYIRRGGTLAASDTIPNGVLNYDPYLTGICLRWAERKVREEVPYWQQRHDQAVARLEQYLAARGQHHAAVIKPAYIRQRRVV